MTAGMDDYGYVLVYEIGGEQRIETFYTKQEMEQFIGENNVRPLFHYEEKVRLQPLVVEKLAELNREATKDVVIIKKEVFDLMQKKKKTALT